MPAYKDKLTGKWYVNFYAKDKRGNNKKYKKTGFPTKKEAIEYEYEFKKIKYGEPEIQYKFLVAEYLKEHKETNKQSSHQGVEIIFNNFIIPYFGELNLSNITPGIIKDFVNYLKAYETKYKAPMSYNYFKAIYGQLSATFNYAIRYYGLVSNPCHKVKKNFEKDTKKEYNTWTVDQFNTFIEYMEVNCENAAVIITFKLLFWTGMRLGELLALTFGDVDLENKTLNINKTKSRVKGGYDITSPKTKSSIRIIQINDELASELEEYISNFYKPNKKEELISFSREGLRNYLKIDLLKSLNLPKISTHDFRHSHATHLIKLDIDIVTISKRLGHISPKTTLEIYSHVYDRTNQELLDKLNTEYMKVRKNDIKDYVG